MPKSFLLMNETVVISFPRAIRECFMFGFRWKTNFIGVIIGGEEVDPRQKARYDMERSITEILDRPEDTRVSISSG